MRQIHCLVCGSQVLNDSTDGVQPSGGTLFYTRGHYGSTIYDPMSDSERLEVVICDPCIVKNRDKFSRVEVVIEAKETYHDFEVSESEEDWVMNQSYHFVVMEGQPFTLPGDIHIEYISSQDGSVTANINGTPVTLRVGDKLPSSRYEVKWIADKETLEDAQFVVKNRISLEWS